MEKPITKQTFQCFSNCTRRSTDKKKKAHTFYNFLMNHRIQTIVLNKFMNTFTYFKHLLWTQRGNWKHAEWWKCVSSNNKIHLNSLMTPTNVTRDQTAWPATGRQLALIYIWYDSAAMLLYTSLVRANSKIWLWLDGLFTNSAKWNHMYI